MDRRRQQGDEQHGWPILWVIGCYESPKKERVQTLSHKYQVVQCRQDINSVGT